jgi:hypothetical protein
MHVTPIDSWNFSVLPLFTRLFYPNPCPPFVCPLPAQPVRWQCSVCVRLRQRYCVGMVITNKRAFWCLRTHSEQANLQDFRLR